MMVEMVSIFSVFMSSRLKAAFLDLKLRQGTFSSLYDLDVGVRSVLFHAGGTTQI
jgi:hypothetical protein